MSSQTKLRLTEPSGLQKELKDNVEFVYEKNYIKNHDFGVNFWGNVGEIFHIFSIF